LVPVISRAIEDSDLYGRPRYSKSSARTVTQCSTPGIPGSVRCRRSAVGGGALSVQPRPGSRIVSPSREAAQGSPGKARHRPVPGCGRPTGSPESGGCRPAVRSQTARAISPSKPGRMRLLGPLTGTKPNLSWPRNLNLSGHITPRIALTVKRTIAWRRQISTGLSALKTQKVGRQNGRDFGQVVSRFLIAHARLNGSRSKPVHDFT
jgi:hypothetical protein